MTATNFNSPQSHINISLSKLLRSNSNSGAQMTSLSNLNSKRLSNQDVNQNKQLQNLLKDKTNQASPKNIGSRTSLLAQTKTNKLGA